MQRASRVNKHGVVKRYVNVVISEYMHNKLTEIANKCYDGNTSMAMRAALREYIERGEAECQRS